MYRIAMSMVLLLFGLMALVPSAAAASLERGNGPEPATLDPHRAQDVSGLNLLRDLCEGLYAPARNGGLELGQAESVQRSADRRVLTFRLRAGLRWSDGAPLVAQDFQRSYTRLLDPTTGSPWTPAYDAIERVEASDARTLVLHLRRAEPRFEERLALPAACPVRLNERGEVSTVGNGAFRLVARRPQQVLELARNPHYRAAAAVVLDRVHFHVTPDAQAEYRRYLAGELHLTETVPPGRVQWLAQRHGAELRLSPYAGSTWLNLNLRLPVLGDLRMRQALALAIDREVLTEVVLGAGQKPGFAIVPQVLWTTDGAEPVEGTQATREQAARALWAELQSPPQVLELRYNANPEQRRLMQAIAVMWRQVLGLRTALRPQEWTAFQVMRRNPKATEVFRGGLIADVSDPVAFLANFRSDAGFNFGGLADPDFDRLLDQARAASSPWQRESLARRAEQRLLSTMAVIPLYQLVSRHLVRPEVCGYRPHPLDHQPSRFLWLAPAGDSATDPECLMAGAAGTLDLRPKLVP